MRVILAALFLFTLTACGQADDKKDAKKENELPMLKIGDPAPALKSVKWYNGSAIANFETGKVYVLDFWATYCETCIKMMPHLTELEAEYKDKGLVVISVTSISKRNSMASIEQYIRKRGPKLGFRFAVSDTEDNDINYMEASGTAMLPATFIVDQKGKIAYFGSPIYLSDILPKVIAGKWRGQPDVDEIEKMNEELGAALATAETNPANALAALRKFEGKYPTKAAQPAVAVSKLVLMLQAKEYDAAKTLTESLMASFIEKKNSVYLGSLRTIWMDAEANPEKKFVSLSVKAADAVLAIEGDKDPMALLGAALAYHAAGQSPRAVEFAEKAIANSDDEDLKKYAREKIEVFKK